MNNLLERLCGLLKSPRGEQQMAAAIVLAELGPRDSGVLKALTQVLPTANRPLKLALVEAIGRLAMAQAVPSLLPLLESPDEEVRDRAAQALVKIGPASIRPIAQQVTDAPASARRALIAVLSRVATADSVLALLTLVESGHPEAAREAAQALIALAPLLGRADQSKLRTQIARLLRLPPDNAATGALSAGLHVLGVIGQASQTVDLLRLTGPRYTETVRRDALLAISGVLRSGIIPPRILAGILPIITDGPNPVLRTAALEVLAAVQLPPTAMEALFKLLESTDPPVRRFAARALSAKGLGGLRAGKRLVPLLLSDNDPSLREAVAESLARVPEAAPLLMDELIKTDAVHRGWVLANVLKHHAARLKRAPVRALFDRASRALAADDQIWEPLLHVVRKHDPKLMYEWLMAEAARLRKARKYNEAEACLKPLSRGDHFDGEARYALGVAGVKAAKQRGIGGPVTPNSCVDLFRQLVRDSSFPLVDRLKKERAHLTTEDLYFLGFVLSEGTTEEKEAGAEVLKLVAARAGATRIGRSAKSKLRSEGLAL